MGDWGLDRKRSRNPPRLYESGLIFKIASTFSNSEADQND